jgi:hypothetical protein
MGARRFYALAGPFKLAVDSHYNLGRCIGIRNGERVFRRGERMDDNRKRRAVLLVAPATDPLSRSPTGAEKRAHDPPPLDVRAVRRRRMRFCSSTGLRR